MRPSKKLLLVLAAICLGLGVQNTVQGCSIREARSRVNPCLCQNLVEISYTLTLEAGEHIDIDDVLLIEFEPDRPNSFGGTFGDLRTSPFDLGDEVPHCNFDGPRCATNIFDRGYFPTEFVLEALPLLPIPAESNVFIWSTFRGGLVNEQVELGFFYTAFGGGILFPPFARIIPHSATIYRVDGTVHHQCGIGLSEDGNGATP